MVERVPYILDGVVAPEEDLLESLAFQYYGRAPIPAQVLLPPGQLERTAPLEEVLGARSQRAVKVIRPYRGPNADAIRMAIHNAELLLAEGLGSRKTRDRALARVAELLGLSSLPRRIETYDMSQFQSAEPVGAMVVFINGQPEKKAWRTYGIRLEEGPGDVGFMREVLKRRFANLRDNPEDMPDLIVLDGGESQLSVGISVMAEAGLSIPMVALAKARVIDHGFGPSKKIPERLYVQDVVAGVADSAGFRQIVPQAHDAGLHLLMRMRDEAHRFVVKFHRKRRFKKGTGSILDGIAGLGPKRRVMLLRHFRTVGNIKSASLEELNEVLPMGVAKAVFDKIHGTE